MSLATWKKEFCPISARSLLKKSKLAMVERDLKKWEGLTRGNLDKHGVGHQDQRISDGRDVFTIDASTCALCKSRRRYDCISCPLYIVRSRVMCDDVRPTESESPYHWFTHLDKPHRMIYWLKRAKKMLEEKA